VHSLASDARLQLGESACVEVVEPRTECGRFEQHQGKLRQEAAGRLGVMARVLASGPIRVGDPARLLVAATGVQRATVCSPIEGKEVCRPTLIRSGRRASLCQELPPARYLNGCGRARKWIRPIGSSRGAIGRGACVAQHPDPGAPHGSAYAVKASPAFVSRRSGARLPRPPPAAMTTYCLPPAS
jgi:hypothetical protein